MTLRASFFLLVTLFRFHVPLAGHAMGRRAVISAGGASAMLFAAANDGDRRGRSGLAAVGVVVADGGRRGARRPPPAGGASAGGRVKIDDSDFCQFKLFSGMHPSATGPSGDIVDSLPPGNGAPAQPIDIEHHPIGVAQAWGACVDDAVGEGLCGSAPTQPSARGGPAQDERGGSTWDRLAAPNRAVGQHFADAVAVTGASLHDSSAASAPPSARTPHTVSEA